MTFKNIFIISSLVCGSFVAHANMSSLGNIKSVGYTCTDSSGEDIVDFSVESNGKPYSMKASVSNYPVIGKNMDISVDMIEYQVNLTVLQGNVDESVSGQLFDGGFTFMYQGENRRCMLTHKDPSKDLINKMAYDEMVKIYQDVKDLDLVMNDNSGNEVDIGVKLGGSIKSVQSLKQENVECLRFHREGKAITTVICMHPSDNGNGAVLFKMVFSYDWNENSESWQPALYGWEEGESPLYMSNAQLQKLLNL